MAEAYIVEAVRTRSKELVLATEFDTLVLRDAKLRRAIAKERADPGPQPDYMVQWMEAHSHELPLPAEQFFPVLNALAHGLVQQRLRLGEDVISDELMAWALTRLLPWEADSSG